MKSGMIFRYTYHHSGIQPSSNLASMTSLLSIPSTIFFVYSTLMPIISRDIRQLKFKVGTYIHMTSKFMIHVRLQN